MMINQAKQMMRIYLDIDGVLVGRPDPARPETGLAPFAAELLELCLDYFKPFWLSTHSRHGEIEPVLRVFQRYEDQSVMALAAEVPSLKWNVLKTEAIDFSAPFLWIDDQLMAGELKALKKHKCLDRWLQVNTRKDPCALQRVIGLLHNASISV